MDCPWIYALDLLKAEGWDYTLTEVKDRAETSRFSRVEISRNGVAFAAQAPTLDEAVGSLYGLAKVMERVPSQALH